MRSLTPAGTIRREASRRPSLPSATAAEHSSILVLSSSFSVRRFYRASSRRCELPTHRSVAEKGDAAAPSIRRATSSFDGGPDLSRGNCGIGRAEDRADCGDPDGAGVDRFTCVFRSYSTDRNRWNCCSFRQGSKAGSAYRRACILFGGTREKRTDAGIIGRIRVAQLGFISHRNPNDESRRSDSANRRCRNVVWPQMDASCARGNRDIPTVVHDHRYFQRSNELPCKPYEISCRNILQPKLNARRAASGCCRCPSQKSGFSVANVIGDCDEAQNTGVDHQR
jgi:hypothetical protein